MTFRKSPSICSPEGIGNCGSAGLGLAAALVAGDWPCCAKHMTAAENVTPKRKRAFTKIMSVSRRTIRSYIQPWPRAPLNDLEKPSIDGRAYKIKDGGVYRVIMKRKLTIAGIFVGLAAAMVLAVLVISYRPKKPAPHDSLTLTPDGK